MPKTKTSPKQKASPPAPSTLRTRRRRLAAHAQAYAGQLSIAALRNLVEPVEPPQAMLKELTKVMPTFSEDQIYRAAVKALRQARYEKLGFERPAGGGRPNFSMCLTEAELAYVNARARQFGSRAGVIHEALRRFQEAQPLR